MSYIVDLPSLPPMSMNHRENRYAKARKTKEWRHDAYVTIRAADIPPMKRVTVQLVAYPPVKRRRDASNLQSTVKPVVDAMVDAGVVEDDSDRYVHVLSPQIVEPTKPDPLKVWRWQLRITEGLKR